MTDVELSRLLSQLEDSAKKLNAKSDSITTILTTVEEKLVVMGVGLETWLENEPIESSTWSEDSRAANGGNDLEICRQIELGFAKVGGGWHLAVRVERGTGDSDEMNWSHETGPSRLLDASRQTRIKALQLLPRLLVEVNNNAKAALEAIDEAEKLVK